LANKNIPGAVSKLRTENERMGLLELFKKGKEPVRRVDIPQLATEIPETLAPLLVLLIAGMIIFLAVL
jgi:hypothetical protein